MALCLSFQLRRHLGPFWSDPARCPAPGKRAPKPAPRHWGFRASGPLPVTSGLCPLNGPWSGKVVHTSQDRPRSPHASGTENTEQPSDAMLNSSHSEVTAQAPAPQRVVPL